MTRVRASFDDDALPEDFAEAMVKCQGYAPACSDEGECWMDGWCFGNDGTAFHAVRRRIEAHLSGRNVYERGWIKVALDALDHHRLIGSRTLDALKLTAINKRIRREYKGGDER